MRRMLSSAIASAALATACLLTLSAPANAAPSGVTDETTPASTPTAAAAFACPGGYSTAHVVTSVDFLLVHASPGNNSGNVYGQIPGGNQVCLQDSRRVKADNLYWRYGYGYNGSTRVPRSGSGWMAEKYLR